VKLAGYEMHGRLLLLHETTIEISNDKTKGFQVSGFRYQEKEA
jgi:hypothetical protein